jgi:hypothetical protein
MVGGQLEHIRLSTVMVQYQAFSANQINPFTEGSCWLAKVKIYLFVA